MEICHKDKILVEIAHISGRKKWDNTPTPMRDFYSWLADNKPKRSSDIYKELKIK